MPDDPEEQSQPTEETGRHPRLNHAAARAIVPGVLGAATDPAVPLLGR
jgi:hypothetical protein